MKRRSLLLGSAFAAAALSLAAPALAQTKWDLPAAYPAGNPHTQNLNQFAADVQAATKGKLAITVHPNGALFKARGWPLDAAAVRDLVIFPEMDGSLDVPEITPACWDILGKSPDAMMCASSRMVVKRKGAEKPAVLPCTLLPYEPAFEMGTTLKEAAAADGGMFANGAVKLAHPHCAKFCVLGGGSCS